MEHDAGQEAGTVQTGVAADSRKTGSVARDLSNKEIVNDISVALLHLSPSVAGVQSRGRAKLMHGSDHI